MAISYRSIQTYVLFLVNFAFDSGWTQSGHPPYYQDHSGSSHLYPGSISHHLNPDIYHNFDYPQQQEQQQTLSSGFGSSEPSFTTTALKLTAELGDSVVLPCEVEHLGDGTVLWKKGPRVISAGPVKVRKDARLTLVEAASLRITKVDVSDTGNYTCEIEWEGTPKQIVHFLEVQVPPQIEAILPGGYGQIERPLEAREGTAISLECRADGIPTPVIRWRTPKNEFPGVSLIKSPKGPILHLSNVQKEDAGTYICTASNGVGSMSADQIELEVLYPPEVTSSSRIVNAWPGGNAVLSCKVNSQPRATIIWALEGVPIQPDSHHFMEEHDTLAVLRIPELRRGDLGNYSCIAKNNQGQAKEHIELSGKPEVAKINSSPEGLYRDKYNLTWTVKSMVPLRDVRLLFRNMDQTTNYNHNLNGSWNNIMLQSPTLYHSYDSIQRSSSISRLGGTDYHFQSHVFRDLEPNSRYEVIVQSKNEFGWSEPTKSFIFRTTSRDYTPKPFASHPSFQNGTAGSQLYYQLSLLILEMLILLGLI